MIKTAIFVEGQTELIFVREMLLKLFEWQNISIECYTLFVDHQHHPTEYAFPSNEIDPELYFFHPATNLQAIFQLSNDSYDKSKGDVNKLMSYIEKEDFEYLATSDKCESFRTFYRSVDYRSDAE